jgi:hypothetical protein
MITFVVKICCASLPLADWQLKDSKALGFLPTPAFYICPLASTTPQKA